MKIHSQNFLNFLENQSSETCSGSTTAIYIHQTIENSDYGEVTLEEVIFTCKVNFPM